MEKKFRGTPYPPKKADFGQTKAKKVAIIGPSIVRALPVAAGRNEGGHYF